MFCVIIQPTHTSARIHIHSIQLNDCPARACTHTYTRLVSLGAWWLHPLESYVKTHEGEEERWMDGSYSSDR